MGEPAKCPQCGKVDTRPVRPCGVAERLLSLLTIYPLRCQLCTYRFRRFLGRPHAAPRRQYGRMPVRYAAAIWPTECTGEAPAAEGTTINLSVRGCALQSRVSVPEGSRVRMQLRIRDEDSPIQIEEAVVRYMSGDRIGVEFLTLQAEEEGRLRHLIEHLRHGSLLNDFTHL